MMNGYSLHWSTLLLGLFLLAFMIFLEYVVLILVRNRKRVASNEKRDEQPTKDHVIEDADQ